MKITTYPISNFYPKNALDKSQICYQVTAVSVNELTKLKHGIVIFGLADDSGIKNVGGRTGAALGPIKIREKLYRFAHPNCPVKIYDLGDLTPEQKIEDTHTLASEVISKIHQAGHFPLILGGGHDLAYPEARSLILSKPKQKLKILNIDAHLDLRPTFDGITSGSPWYLLFEDNNLKKYTFQLVEFGIQTHCNAQSLYDYAKAKKISVIKLEDIYKKKTPTTKQVQEILKKEKISMVSIDIDSVALQYAPGCSAAQTLGFTAEDVIQFSYSSGASHHVQSFGIYETSPPLDLSGSTPQLVAHCINQFIYGYSTRFRKRAK
ncbi:MAG: formimidoylglutamase [Oligoflexia bacterium]|nr:formimidoylglutamase [Oligoflexia bacterium]